MNDKKNFFITEEGFEAYTMDCGCEGIKLPEYGWKCIMCDFHESEQNMFTSDTKFHKIKKFNEKEEK